MTKEHKLLYRDPPITAYNMQLQTDSSPTWKTIILHQGSIYLSVIIHWSHWDLFHSLTYYFRFVLIVPIWFMCFYVLCVLCMCFAWLQCCLTQSVVLLTHFPLHCLSVLQTLIFYHYCFNMIFSLSGLWWKNILMAIYSAGTFGTFTALCINVQCSSLKNK